MPGPRHTLLSPGLSELLSAVPAPIFTPFLRQRPSHPSDFPSSLLWSTPHYCTQQPAPKKSAHICVCIHGFRRQTNRSMTNAAAAGWNAEHDGVVLGTNQHIAKIVWTGSSRCFRAWRGKMQITATAFKRLRVCEQTGGGMKQKVHFRSYWETVKRLIKPWREEPRWGMRRGRAGQGKGGVVAGVEWCCRPSISSIFWQQGQRSLLPAQRRQVLSFPARE